MGYDCYIRGENVPKSPKCDWDCQEPFGGEEWAAWMAKYYFQRNIWGGSRLAEALIEMGMGFDAEQYGQHPAWPDMNEYGVDYNDEGELVGERVDDYRKALDEVLDWHGPEIPGIPVHKVAGSNDGWHVTREEAQSALLIYERAIAEGKEHPAAFSDDFIPFLREAARHDGFETH